MILLNRPKDTLGKLINNQKIDPDIRTIISQVYGLSSNKDFVRHGGVQNQLIGKLEAEFFLDFAASAIIYIKGKLKWEPWQVKLTRTQIQLRSIWASYLQRYTLFVQVDGLRGKFNHKGHEGHEGFEELSNRVIGDVIEAPRASQRRWP